MTRREILLSGATAITSAAHPASRAVVQDGSGSPTRIAICLPYPGAAGATEAWASGEREVAWRQEGEAEERCTVSFAAVELRDALRRSVKNHDFHFSDRLPADGPAILVGPVERLSRHFPGVTEPPSSTDIQIVSRLNAGRQLLVLAGADRRAALYAVYRYLEELGWRWYAPSVHGEVAPAERAELPLSGLRIESGPDFELRGFWVPVASPSLFVWMARNRLNYFNAEYVPGYFTPLMKKLGFFIEVGGHMTPRILNPARTLSNGKTMFDEHPTWYAEIGGKRERKNAARYQYCVSNPAATGFVANAVVEDIVRDFSMADRYHFGLYDTWSGWCRCSNCKALGNDGDKYLHVAAKVWEAVEQAKRSGRIRNDIQLSIAAYEGIPSLRGPSRTVPAILDRGAPVSAVYFPINRCYSHSFADPECQEMNERYRFGLDSWLATGRSVPVEVCEYYQVSRWEDLPIVFAPVIATDLPYWRRKGVRGISFMHAPVEAWGPRTFDYLLFGKLAWSTSADVASLRKEFFSLYYERAAEVMSRFHELLARALSNITPWRAWDAKSALGALAGWKKGIPEKPLFQFHHLQPDAAASSVDKAIGPAESIALLDSCRELMKKALGMELASPAGTRISEDARLFRYGDETLRLMWRLARIYEFERQGKPELASQEWPETDRLARSLDSYYVPHSYDYPDKFEDLPTGTTGPRIKDALTRTQLRPLVERLRTVYRQSAVSLEGGN